MRKIKVLVLGSIYLESQYFIDDNKTDLTSRFASGFSERPGSKGINAARTFAKLGAEVDFYGLIGQDSLAKQIKNSFLNYGISTKHIKEIKSQTGRILTTTPQVGEPEYVVYSGANDYFSQKHVSHISEIINEYDLFYTNSKYKPKKVSIKYLDHA